MKQHIPYFDFYPSDFMNGVRGMTAQEVGVYTMLLCRIYEECAPVEFNMMRLATYCGMRQATFEKTITKLIELGKFQVAENRLSNDRANIEISKRADKLKLNSKAGLESGKKRQQKQREASTDVQRTLNHTEAEADTDTNTSTDVEVAPAPAGSGPLEREQILKAIGADPVSGMIGPNGTMIGRTTDMAEQAKWTALGISLDDQCAIIRERVQSAARGGKVLAPRSFSYFSGAMSDFAAAKSKPMPVGVASHSQANATDAKLARWNRIAGQA